MKENLNFPTKLSHMILIKKKLIINSKSCFFSFFLTNICIQLKTTFHKYIQLISTYEKMSQTPSAVWNNCLSFIKDNIQPQAYKTWFEPIIPVKLTDDVLSTQVPSKFFYEWLEEHYVKLLKLALNKELGENARLIYVIKMENTFGNLSPFTEKIPSQYKTNIPSQKVDLSIGNLQTELRNPFVIPGIKNLKIESQLNPNYTFDNFLEGDANRLARSAGLAVSNKPGGTSFNPLLIFGGVIISYSDFNSLSFFFVKIRSSVLG